MDNQQSASSVEIKSKNNLTAPTPQNTPINPAPITSKHHPTIPSISEDAETINTTADSTSMLAGAFASNPALLNMLQGKLGTLVGRSSGYIESLPSSVKRRLNGLRYLKSKHAELENKFQEEVLALEKKYLVLYQPLYNQRAEIISGSYEPTDEEVAIGEKVDQDDEVEKDEDDEEIIEETNQIDAENDESIVKGIPEFWLSLLKNHPQLAETVTDEDEDALKHLVDVRMSYMDQPGFRLTFEFEDNDYFTDKELTKTYYYQDHAYGGDFVYDHAEGCKINWNDGKDLTVTIETKKQRHKGTNKTRVVKRTVPSNSFFYFFTPPTIPDDDDLEEEEAEGLDSKLEADYEMGEEFKDKIIPHAVDWFTGKALQYEDYGEEEEDDEYYEDEDEDDEDDDDEDEENDDDDDDDDAVATSNGEKAPECKQS